HGLFLESAPEKPFLYAPVGTRANAAGRGELGLGLPDRSLTLRVGGTGNPAQLAADTADFLAGERPVPDPRDYRRPWWLVGLAAVLAAALAAGPVMLTRSAGLGLDLGL